MKCRAAADTATQRAQHSWGEPRNARRCQGCGQQPAVEAHHWATRYPLAHATTADELVALCAVCHRYDVARYGGTLDELAKTAQFTVPVVVYGKRIRGRGRGSTARGRWSGWPTSTRSSWTRRS